MNLEKNHIELKKKLIKNLTKSYHANLINIHLLNNKSKLKGVELFNVNHNFNPKINCDEKIPNIHFEPLFCTKNEIIAKLIF